MPIFSSLRDSLSSDQGKQVAAVAAAGVGLYIVGKVVREITHNLYPAYIPGEPNTALLASPRPKSRGEVSVKDLENVSEYDYIIVGTGTAGVVLATRLTEDPNVKVLAIEAGHSDAKQLFSRIPAGFARLFGSPADYNYYTDNEPEMKNRRMFYPQGKMLGGSSSINAMIYNKGSPADFDEWEKLGNTGWGYKDVKDYAKRAEGFTPSPDHPTTTEELSQHGRNGPWKTGYSWFASEKFVEACAAVGIPKVNDVNTDRGITGVSACQSFIDPKGQRSSTAAGYFTQEVASRSNLKIATGQTVTKIIFDTTGAEPRAVGVEMAGSKLTPVRYLAKAKREVIVSAGACNTPKILKISGVGPAGELAKHGVKVIKDIKGVGENLVDHLFITLVFRTRFPSIHYLGHPLKSIPALIEWLRFGTGAMSSQAADAAAFLRVADRADCPKSLKDNDLTTGPGGADLEILTGNLGYIEHGRNMPDIGKDWTSIGPVMLRPESRGTVTLASVDPFAEPVIRTNYLATKHDRDFMTYGVKLSREICKSAPYKDGFIEWHWPNKNVDSMTDEELLDWIRRSAETIYHPMGTARMGPKGDAGAVVDARLKVHGVQGLRVVDASVFPTPVACHPCAPVVMTAEKASDLIREDWAGKSSWTDKA